MLLETLSAGLRGVASNSGLHIFRSITNALEQSLTGEQFTLVQSALQKKKAGQIIETSILKHLSNAIGAGRNVREVEREAEIIEGRAE